MKLINICHNVEAEQTEDGDFTKLYEYASDIPYALNR